MIRDDFNQGERLTADWVNQVSTELKRLARMSGAGGISISTSTAGIVVRYNPESTPLAIVQFQATEATPDYPTFDDFLDDGCFNYPAKLCPQATFDAETCVAGVDMGDEGEEVSVCNVLGAYIPDQTITLAWRINGQWFCEAHLAYRLTVTLPALLSSDASKDDCEVTEAADGLKPADTVKVYNELGFHSAGGKAYVEWKNETNKYQIYQCPC